MHGWTEQQGLLLLGDEKGTNSHHLQQHGWAGRTPCYVREVRQRQTRRVRPHARVGTWNSNTHGTGGAKQGLGAEDVVSGCKLAGTGRLDSGGPHAQQSGNPIGFRPRNPLSVLASGVLAVKSRAASVRVMGGRRDGVLNCHVVSLPAHSGHPTLAGTSLSACRKTRPPGNCILSSDGVSCYTWKGESLFWARPRGRGGRGTGCIHFQFLRRPRKVPEEHPAPPERCTEAHTATKSFGRRTDVQRKRLPRPGVPAGWPSP